MSFNDDYAVHIPVLQAHALRITKSKEDAEDLVQETMFKAFQFLINNPDEVILSPKNWLFRILINSFINSNRSKSSKMVVVGLPDDFETGQLSASAEDDAEYGFIDPRLVQAINALDEDLRECLYLFYCKALSVEQVAFLLDIPNGTVMSRLHRARGLLRVSLADFQTPRPGSE